MGNIVEISAWSEFCPFCKQSSKLVTCNCELEFRNYRKKNHFQYNIHRIDVLIHKDEETYTFQVEKIYKCPYQPIETIAANTNLNYRLKRMIESMGDELTFLTIYQKDTWNIGKRTSNFFLKNWTL